MISVFSPSFSFTSLYSFLSSHVPTDGQINNFPPFIIAFTESYFVQRTVQYSEFLGLFFSGVLFKLRR